MTAVRDSGSTFEGVTATSSDTKRSDVERCRFCDALLGLTVVDLGMSPLCERFLRPDQLDEVEPFFPLHVRACGECGLVQLPEFLPPDEIFTPDYPYHSAYSSSWVAHAKQFVDEMVPRLGLDGTSSVVEVASNDGYLLQHFLPYGIPVLGVDPASAAAEAAVARGVPTITRFFGDELAHEIVEERGRADLVVANNVLAHVPDVNDFVAGVATLLAPSGTATFEFHDLLWLFASVQYDTIYHEHFSYLSLGMVEKILAAAGLEVTDVRELTTHGGSLRVEARHAPAVPAPAVGALLRRERLLRLDDPETYARFAAAVERSRETLLEVLDSARADGKTVAAYGAPGKGNTLLNYCGIGTHQVEYAVDRNPHKHGLFTPGTHLPIYPPSKLYETRPDLIFVLPWNLIGEISPQLRDTTSWGAKLVIPIPEATVFEPGGLPSD